MYLRVFKKQKHTRHVMRNVIQLHHGSYISRGTYAYIIRGRYVSYGRHEHYEDTLPDEKTFYVRETFPWELWETHETSPRETFPW